MDWRLEFEHELVRALQARDRGNEGQGRVCARRAAGIIAREYLARRGLHPGSRSAIDLLEQLRRQVDLPAPSLLLIEHLTQRVDEAFRLPPDVDLIAEARKLRSNLLPE